MIEETGLVLDVREGRAKVEVENRGGACCGGCVFCSDDGSGRTIEVDAVADLTPGDRVQVRVPVRSVLVSSLLLLIVPMLLLVGGTILAAALFPVEGPPGRINIPAVAAGFGLMALWYVGVRLVEGRSGPRGMEPPRIVRIIGRETPEGPDNAPRP